MHGLVNDGCARGTGDGSGLIVNGREDGALVDHTVCVGDGALVDAGLEGIRVPAVQEVAVKSESCTDVSGFVFIRAVEKEIETYQWGHPEQRRTARHPF